ncbi:vacuolar protein sorting-associated protein 35 [Rhizophagus irregularis]|uniref:Vacuolar protein sorting-associated protein 35 n=1 Tax=Rhizophagus irregularis TaxID=588596 RepID=A0A2I1GAT9_9GLOM|nr:vacuolar protein sorting-associated protein 35 [Rhizophagus irregularis]
MEDQMKLLEEALNVVRVQAHHMKKCLDNNKLMDGLKHCSTMLAELRTSALTPKHYYELYMAIFDALRHLTTYLNDAHNSGKHHLADLYELVQYAGNIIPRLYLMITVGSVYMSQKDAPVKEIMKDMMEMSRGVQHPTRGLFLRHYLSGMTRDSLPVGNDDGPQGNLQDSISFILTNFIEMNKLWVRLQHQGHSRDREKREMERKELRILVGTNLVRLSQLEGVDLQLYQKTILPGILEQVINCKDVIAQEYLMEVIIQVFHDDFHLRTLGPYLSATALLHPKVNVKQIVIALIDRLAAYAAREADSEPPEVIKRQKEEAAKRLYEKLKKQNIGGYNEEEDNESNSNGKFVLEEEEDEEEEEEKEKLKEDTGFEFGNFEREELNGETGFEFGNINDDNNDNNQTSEPQPDETKQQGNNKSNEPPVKRFRGIPEDVKLFEVFWGQIVDLVKARPDLSIQDITALLVSLVNLSLSCYPDKIEYVDQVIEFAKQKVLDFHDSPDLHSSTTTTNLLNLLLAPINSYPTVLTLLALPNYAALLLAEQPFQTRRSIAHAIVTSILKNETLIETPEDVSGILDLCNVLIRDQKDATLSSPFSGLTGGRGTRSIGTSQKMDPEEFAEEQGWLARIIHLFQSSDPDVQFMLLTTARKQFAEGGERIRYTFPALVTSAVKLARRYQRFEDQDDGWEKKTSSLFRFIHQIISILYNKVECSDICLRLFLLAGQSADECGFEEICYEFFVQAFTIYEESISESRAQFQAITLIIGTLQTIRVFGLENYDTLITKCALHGSKLLKKPDQCRAVYLSSHLWWATEIEGRGTKSSEELFREGKRVLECLQKALKIADSCMDSVTNVELFVEILNRYIYYFEKKNEAVTVKYLNGLIDLINTHLNNIENPDQHPPTSASSALVEPEGNISDFVVRHFKSTLFHLETRKEAVRSAKAQGDLFMQSYDEIDTSTALGR